jgi:Holliday junction resolvase-like predicted endonuclease
MLRFLISFALILQLALTPAFAIVKRPHNTVINNGHSSLVHGQDFFDGLDQVGRTFLVTETIAIAQFGIGELGNGSDTQWEGSIGHLLLHGGVGCLALEALNGDCVAGFFSGASSSLLAGSNLTDEQILRLAPLLGALTGFVFSGGVAVNVSFGGTVAQSGIVNNYLTHENRRALLAEIAACELEAGGVAGSCDRVDDIIAFYQEVSTRNERELSTRCNEDINCVNDELAQIATTGWDYLIENYHNDYRDLHPNISPGETVSFYLNQLLLGSSNYGDGFVRNVCGGVYDSACRVKEQEVMLQLGIPTVMGLTVVGGLVVVGPELLAACLASTTCTLGLTAAELADMTACAIDPDPLCFLPNVSPRVVDNLADAVPNGTFVNRVDYSDSFDVMRGTIDSPLELASLSNRQIGALGEDIATHMLVQNGYTIQIAVRNASDNGIDIVARAPDGRMVFFEVKTTRVGTVPNTSLQSNSQAYISGIMQETATGTLRGQPISADLQNFAQNYVNSAIVPTIPANIIGVNLVSEQILVSAW